ncbi:MAG: dsbC [Ramlibacter sp.]|uniref:DsbC family protein n=1 Tax=Ramlibacter sp. TaxID=1917967 RepID=UPI0026035294|nr:DsbC family protein [Ramlibacter sp.]MDB5752735.1 dsbC [Ramlibacter sp.]
MTLIRSGHLAALAALATLGLLAGSATAQAPATGAVPPAVESALRKNLPERIPQMGKLDEVQRTPIAGLYEVRVGTDIFYTDAEGSYLLHGGQLIDTRSRRNLTEERMDKLLAIDVATLPLKDAFTMVRGNGKRKLVVFEDPNCGYCKRFERDLQKVDNITIHMFLYPILGPDSVDKSRNIWCSKDKARAWMDWMVRDQPTPRADASCDAAALARNLELGRRYKITGTPTLVFADGSRVPGAIGAAEVEKLLSPK